MSNYYIELNERKTVIRRFLYTCFLLVIFLIGNHIQVLSTPNDLKVDKIYKITAANLGGNLDLINIFSLGLGPWLTAMIITMIYYYKYPEKMVKLTQFERSIREKLLTLIIAIFQSYFIVKQAFDANAHQRYEEWIAMLILIAGSMMLVWFVDLNTMKGIAGAMPIVFISIIKSFIKQAGILNNIATYVLVISALCVLFAFVVLLILELAEYRIYYEDIMSVSEPYQKPYIAWKLNPSGSLSIMIAMSVFMFLKYIVEYLINSFAQSDQYIYSFIDFKHPLGMLIFGAMLFLFSYWLSVFMLNPKNRAENFQKNGNYFKGIRPGIETERFIRTKARRISFIGAFVVTLIITLPLFATLLYPKASVEIILAIQIIMVVYIALNMVETVKTLLYFDKYEGFLKRYW